MPGSEGSKGAGRTAGALLMGLALAGCPSDDDGQDTVGNSSSTSTSTTSDPMTSSTSEDVTSFGSAAAYGSPDSETFEGSTDATDSDSTTGGSTGTATGSSTGPDTDTDTDTDGSSTGSTSISPDYGVPPTSG